VKKVKLVRILTKGGRLTISDPIADMLTRIRMPPWQGMMRCCIIIEIKAGDCRILKEEGFIKDFEVVREESHKNIKIYIKYQDRNQPVP